MEVKKFLRKYKMGIVLTGAFILSGSIVLDQAKRTAELFVRNPKTVEFVLPSPNRE